MPSSAQSQPPSLEIIQPATQSNGGELRLGSVFAEGYRSRDTPTRAECASTPLFRSSQQSGIDASISGPARRPILGFIHTGITDGNKAHQALFRYTDPAAGCDPPSLSSCHCVGETDSPRFSQVPESSNPTTQLTSSSADLGFEGGSDN